MSEQVGTSEIASVEEEQREVGRALIPAKSWSGLSSSIR